MAVLDNNSVGIAPESISNLMFMFKLKRIGVGNGNITECVTYILNKVFEDPPEMPEVDTEKELEHSIARIEKACNMDIIIFTSGEKSSHTEGKVFLVDLKQGISFRPKIFCPNFVS